MIEKQMIDLMRFIQIIGIQFRQFVFSFKGIDCFNFSLPASATPTDCRADPSEAMFLTRISHQEIWLWAGRPGNGGGNVPEYVEQTIFGTTRPTDKFRSVWQGVLGAVTENPG